MKGQDYIALDLHSDWGVPYYAEHGKGLDPAAGTARIELGFGFTEEQPVDVLFPDGAEARVKITHDVRTVEVPDMGHSYEVEARTPGFTWIVHGVRVWLPLGAVKVRRDGLRMYRRNNT